MKPWNLLQLKNRSVVSVWNKLLHSSFRSPVTWSGAVEEDMFYFHWMMYISDAAAGPC